MLLGELSWPKAKKYWGQNKLVILPVGSCEQHGLHMPLGTDYLVAGEIAKRLGERLDCLVAPTVNYGHAPWHIDSFVGTISFDQEQLYDIYYTITKQLIGWGTDHLIFINGHGGNSPVLKRLAMNLRMEFDVLCMVVDWWNLAGQMNPAWIEKGHAGKPETAAMRYLFPNLVNMDDAQFHDYKPWGEDIEVTGSASLVYKGITNNIWLTTKDICDIGNYGEDPKLGTVKMGQEEIEAVLDYLSEFVLQKFSKMKVENK